MQSQTLLPIEKAATAPVQASNANRVAISCWRSDILPIYLLVKVLQFWGSKSLGSISIKL